MYPIATSKSTGLIQTVTFSQLGKAWKNSSKPWNWSHDNNNFLRKYFKSFFHLVKQRNTPIKIWQLIPTVSLPHVFLDINEPKMFCWHNLQSQAVLVEVMSKVKDHVKQIRYKLKFKAAFCNSLFSLYQTCPVLFKTRLHLIRPRTPVFCFFSSDDG